MFEGAQRVSVMDSNFYSAELDMEIKFQQNSTQVTSPSPTHFYHGLGSLRRIPSPDPEKIEGFSYPFTLKTVSFGLIVPFSEVDGSTSVDNCPSENSRQSTPASASTFPKS